MSEAAAKPAVIVGRVNLPAKPAPKKQAKPQQKREQKPQRRERPVDPRVANLQQIEELKYVKGQLTDAKNRLNRLYAVEDAARSLYGAMGDPSVREAFKAELERLESLLFPKPLPAVPA